MSELKPCPFCGGEAKLEHDYIISFVKCVECDVRTVGYHVSPEYSSDARAAEVWNRRMNDD